MNRSRSDDQALAAGAQGLAMLSNMRNRFALLGRLLRLHYPGRIRTCSIYPPGPIVSFAVSALRSMFKIFPFSVNVRGREEMRAFHGAAALPVELGGDSPCTFALSDVMLPMMKLRDYSSIALRFDNTEMEKKFVRPQHSVSLLPQSLLSPLPHFSFATDMACGCSVTTQLCAFVHSLAPRWRRS